MVIFPNTLFKNKILISLILASVAVLALIFTGSFVLRAEETITAKKTELAQLKGELELLDKLLLDQKNNQEKVDAVTKTLPRTFEDVAFAISQIERISEKNGQKLETKMGEVALPEPNDLLSLKVTLKTSGGYHSFSQMLTDLARLPYHTQVDTLKIEEGGKEITNLVDLRLYLAKEGNK